jgi:hypothetical protein
MPDFIIVEFVGGRVFEFCEHVFESLARCVTDCPVLVIQRCTSDLRLIASEGAKMPIASKVR